MKIAYLVNHYPHTTHSFVRRELRALETIGIEVERITIRAPTDELPEEQDRSELGRTFAVLDRGLLPLLVDLLWVGVTSPLRWLRTLGTALRMGARSHAGPLRHLAYLAEACTVLRFVRSRDVRHVHAHFGTNAAMVALLARRLGGPPYSFTIHGPGEFDAPELLHLPQKVEGACFVVAITDFARSQTYRWTDPRHWDKIHVIRCSIDERFRDHPIEPIPDRPRLVCIGRLGHSKGHTILIEAAARLVEDGIKFEILLVGDGPMRSQLEARIREKGLEDTLRLAGWVDQLTVERELLASRALVLPSFGEGLPVVIMEAFALARPVISTRIAGIPELLVDAQNGWLITSGSVAELDCSLRQVLGTPVERLLEMGEAGRRAVLARHDASVEARKLAELLWAAHGEQGRSGDPAPLSD